MRGALFSPRGEGSTGAGHDACEARGVFLREENRPQRDASGRSRAREVPGAEPTETAGRPVGGERRALAFRGDRVPAWGGEASRAWLAETSPSSVN